MDQFLASNIGNRRLNTALCRSSPGSWFSTPHHLKSSQLPFLRSENSNQSAGVKLLRLDSQGYDDTDISSSQANTRELGLKAMCASHLQNDDPRPNSYGTQYCTLLPWKNILKSGLDGSRNVWSNTNSLSDEVMGMKIGVSVQQLGSSSSKLLSKFQYVQSLNDIAANGCSTPLTNYKSCIFNDDNSSQINLVVSSDQIVDSKTQQLSEIIASSSAETEIEEKNETNQKVARQVSTGRHSTCQPKFLCRRKNHCLRFSDRKLKYSVSKPTYVNALCRLNIQVNRDCIVDSAEDGLIDCYNTNIGIDNYSGSSSEHCPRSETNFASCLSDISSFIVHPSELDSESDCSDEDWNGLVTSCVSESSFNSKCIQTFLAVHSCSTTDFVCKGIANTEDEIDGISKMDSSRCSKKSDFKLDSVNAKWNECYSVAEGSDDCNQPQNEKQKANLRKTFKMHVVFCDEITFMPIPNAAEWADDYSAARCGLWTVDRSRFNDRISEVERQISWIFSEEHRTKCLAIISRLCNQSCNTPV